VRVIPTDTTTQSLQNQFQPFADDLFEDSSLILTSTADTSSSHYLTSFDHINRQRGYNTYLPSSSHQYELYWKLLYGIDVSTSSSSEYSTAFTLHQIPEMLSSSGSGAPQTVQVMSSSGPKVVPRCVLYSRCEPPFCIVDPSLPR
jgi:hypothetical protein